MENGIMLQGFSWYLTANGNHWKKIALLAPRLAQMGITAVWLPPAYKTAEGDDGVGYSVYDLWDLGEFDQCGSVRTKYGTKKDYLEAVSALKAVGIQTLADVVLNQRFGGEECEDVRATEIDPLDRTHQLGEEKDISAWTRFSFPARKSAYSSFKWDWSCFHGSDWDEKTEKEGIYLFSGKHFDEDVDCHENGNFDFLMGLDVDVNDPRVKEELTNWGLWYLKETGVDGFRLDALKHISRSFYRSWLSDMRKALGREIFTVGEYWSGSADDLLAYLGDDRPMSLFDVPLHYKLFSASNSWGALDLSHLFDDTLVAKDPVHAVTFVENHDTQPGQSLQSTVESWFKPSAYMLILLREAGYPCVFFADLFGTKGDDIPAVVELPLLMELRQLFAYGTQHDFFDDPNVIGWTREGDNEHKNSALAAVITDAKGGTKHMFVGEAHIGQTFVCVLGDGPDVYIDDQGFGDFSTPDGAGSVYILKEALLSLRHDRIKSAALKAPIPRIGATPTSVNTAPRRNRIFRCQENSDRPLESF